MKRPYESISNTSASRFELPSITITPNVSSSKKKSAFTNASPSIGPKLSSGFSSPQQVREEFYTPPSNIHLNQPLSFPADGTYTPAMVNRIASIMNGPPTNLFGYLPVNFNNNQVPENINTAYRYSHNNQSWTNSTGQFNDPALTTANQHDRAEINNQISEARPADMQIGSRTIECNNESLFEAIKLNDVYSIKIMLKNPHFKEKLGQKNNLKIQNPLTAAINSGHIEVVKLLLEDKKFGKKFANYSSDRKKREEQPILAAIKLGRVDIVNTLLEFDAKQVLRPSNRRGLVIHFAVESGNTEVVRLLLRYGIDNTQTQRVDQNGCNAMLLATKLDHVNIVELLLQQSDAADQLKCIDNTSMSVLKYAEQNKNQKIIDLLSAHEKKENLKKSLINLQTNNMAAYQVTNQTNDNYATSSAMYQPILNSQVSNIFSTNKKQ